MNVEVRHYTHREPQGRTTIFIGIERQSDARRERYHTSLFEIPCSTFDIQHRLICGTNKNFK
jgi:hypothetical protein